MDEFPKIEALPNKNKVEPVIFQLFPARTESAENSNFPLSYAFLQRLFPPGRRLVSRLIATSRRTRRFLCFYRVVVSTGTGSRVSLDYGTLLARCHTHLSIVVASRR